MDVAEAGKVVRSYHSAVDSADQKNEIIADNLSKAGWSWGWISAVDSGGRTIWIADAHRGDGKRFVVRADEKLTAFVELEIGDSHSHGISLTRRRAFLQNLFKPRSESGRGRFSR
jgi:hypothetical protein